MTSFEQSQHEGRDTREQELERAWSLWQAGHLAEPPSYVPLSWEREFDAHVLPELLASEAVRCEDVADRATRALETVDVVQVNGLRILAALCFVTAERILEVDDDSAVALSACARALERFQYVTGGDDDAYGLDHALGEALRAVRAVLVQVHARS